MTQNDVNVLKNYLCKKSKKARKCTIQMSYLGSHTIETHFKLGKHCLRS